MNWRQILTKGLPVFIIAVVLLVVAIIVSRPKPNPVVTNGNQDVVNFKGYTVTKSDLYNMMKQTAGLSTLLKQVDSALMASYTDQVDMTALNNQIDSDKSSQGEDAFYDNLIKTGVILSKNDTNLTQEIQNSYMDTYLQKAYATAVAKAALTQSDITNAINNYHEDTCIITLTYSTNADAQAEETKLSSLSGTDLLNEFATEYAAQQATAQTTDSVSEPTQTVKPFLTSDQYSCNYYQAVYANYTSSTAFRDFIFGTTTTAGLPNGQYNQTPLQISPNYYIVYKVNTAPAKSTYDQSKLADYVTSQQISDTVTSTYITDKVQALRLTDNFKIYDSAMSASYAQQDSNYKSPSKLYNNNKNVVASYSTDGGKTTQTITADQLYDLLKPQYAVTTLLDHINYAALNAVAGKDGFAFSKTEMASYTTKVTTMKSSFLANGYNQYISWENYILGYYGAFSDSDLAKMLALSDLQQRYLIGYGDWAGAYPVTETELADAYNNWFQYQASEIFFTFTWDPNNTTDATNVAAKALAEQKANEIIHGCTQDEVSSNTCYIKYDSTTETGGTGDYFTAGLDGTSAADLPTVFAALAKAYSQDSGTASNGGDVGQFGPGQMTDDFTNAVKSILAANNGLKGGYSTAPVYDEVTSNGTTTYGYHVVYVTGNTAKAPMPTTDLPTGVTAANMFSATSLTALAAVTDDTTIQNFYTLVSNIKSSLTTSHESSDNEAKELALLRDSLGFKFADATIQQHYQAITTLQEAYTDTTNTSSSSTTNNG